MVPRKGKIIITSKNFKRVFEKVKDRLELVDKKVIITYGSFDFLHYGHIRLLKRARAMGDYLIVGLSTDRFNALKGKKSVQNYWHRRECLEALRYVDKVIQERNWKQKKNDIKNYNAQMVMGSDWKGKFDDLGCIYLPRTKGISSTILKSK